MQITIRQLQVVLRDMGLFNMAESQIESNPEDFAIWKKPATIISREDQIVKRWQKTLGLSDASVDGFFKRAMERDKIKLEENMIDDDEPKWLTIGKSYIGLKEVPGAESNEAIDAFFADAGFPGFHDDTAWCAAYLGAMLKRSGYPTLKSLTARDYLHYGIRLDKPKVGAIAVLWRESRRSWKGHVGFVVSINWEAKTFKILGGNQSDGVNIKTESFDQVLGWRYPVAPTIPALKAAGSKEAKMSEIGKNASFWTMLIGIIGTTLQNNPELAKSLMPDVDAIKAILLKMDELMTTVAQYKYGWLIALGCFFYLLMKQWQLNRVERAERGYPILTEQKQSP